MATRRPVDQFNEVGIPSGGMDTDTVPRLLPPGKAPLLQNFLMDRPGVLPMRGPVCEGTTWNFGASIGLLGVLQFGDKLLVSRMAASASATRDYWVAPYRQTFSSSVLRHVNPTHKHIDLSTGVVTDVAASATGYVGLKGVRVGSFVYYYAGDSVGGDFVTRGDGALEYDRRLCRWDGTTAAPTLYSALNAPVSAMDIAYHYNRLFVLGGCSVDSIATLERNSLFWSDAFAADGSALAASPNSWKDDVTGLFNRIVVGSDDSTDFGVALAHVGPNLCVFKRHSVWMLYGTQPANWQVKQIDNEVGCIDPRSVVEYNGGAFFMSGRGFMFYDGTRLQNVSGGLNSTLAANALKQAGPTAADGGYCRATLLDRGYILVTTGAVDGATLTTTADSAAWLLHAPTGTWTQLSSGAIPTIVAAGRTANNTWLMTDQKLVKANYLFAPQNAPAGTRGFDSIDSGATKFVIPSRWTTRTLALGTPPRKSKLQRITADYYWSLANGGWQVTATTRGDTGVATSTGTLAAPAGIASNLPARAAINLFNETDEVYLDIAATSGAPATFNDAELHRVLVETLSTGPVAGSQ